MFFKGITLQAQRFVPYYKETETKAELSHMMLKGFFFKALTQYLLESTVDSVWTADIEAQEHSVRVAVTKWPHIVIVRRT